MLPRFKQWIEHSVFDRRAARPKDGSADYLSSFISDDKLSVSESTITEYSRVIAVFDALDSRADGRSAPRP